MRKYDIRICHCGHIHLIPNFTIDEMLYGG